MRTGIVVTKKGVEGPMSMDQALSIFRKNRTEGVTCQLWSSSAGVVKRFVGKTVAPEPEVKAPSKKAK